MNRDKTIEKIIKKLPHLVQRQYDTYTQLQFLNKIAHKLGLYDGGDIIMSVLEKSQSRGEKL